MEIQRLACMLNNMGLIDFGLRTKVLFIMHSGLDLPQVINNLYAKGDSALLIISPEDAEPCVQSLS